MNNAKNVTPRNPDSVVNSRNVKSYKVIQRKKIMILCENEREEMYAAYDDYRICPENSYIYSLA